MNRFLKPTQLDDDQRDVVAEVLSRLDIGDAEGRRIFVYALDYELTEYVNFLHKNPPAADEPSPEIPHEIQLLTDALNQVVDSLNRLPEDSRARLFNGLKAHDDYQREYTQEYLDALLGELMRLQAACEDSQQGPAVTRASSTERPESEFVRMLANAYTECFEEPPKPTKSGPFAQLLDVIGEQIQLDLTFDERSLADLIPS